MKKLLITGALALTMTTTCFATFTDVSSNHWAKDSIDYCVSHNYFNGYEDGTFKPSNDIKNAEIAKVLSLVFNLESTTTESVFTDVANYYWAKDYINATAHLFPTTSSNFYPTTETTREEVMYALVIGLGYDVQTADLSVLDGFSDKDSISTILKPYVALAVENKLVEGSVNSYGASVVNPKNSLLRSEFATLLTRVLTNENVQVQPTVPTEPTPTTEFSMVIDDYESVVYGQEQIVITGQINSDEKVSVKVNGYTIYLTVDNRIYEPIEIGYGENVLNFVATNESGKTVSQTVTITNISTKEPLEDGLIDPEDVQISAEQFEKIMEMYKLVNEYRKANGLSSLIYGGASCQVATLKSTDMSENQYLSHTSPTYGSASDMLALYGGYGIKYSAVGENIACGYESAELVFEKWLSSDGHRANILGDYTHIGIGYVEDGHYWTQIFGKK